MASHDMNGAADAEQLSYEEGLRSNACHQEKDALGSEDCNSSNQYLDGAADWTFPSLPAEMWLHIMKILPTVDRFRLAMTNSSFLSLLNSPVLWTERHVTLRRLGDRPLNEDQDRRLRACDIQQKHFAFCLVCNAVPHTHIPGYVMPRSLHTYLAPRESEHRRDAEDEFWFEERSSCDKRPTKQRLTPASSVVLQRFGHHIQHLSLLVQYGCVCLSQSSVNILSRLSNEWKLKSLTLILDSFQHNLPNRLKTLPSSRSGICMVNEILRKATSLEKLDIQFWNVPVTRLNSILMRQLETLSRKGLNIVLPPSLGMEQVLMEEPTCPGLQKLDVAGQPPCSILSMPENITRLAVKFRCLTHLTVRPFMLSDMLLERLAAGNRVPLKTLEVQVFRQYTDCCSCSEPQLDKVSWTALTTSCPKLRVHVFIRSSFAVTLHWALEEWVPVSVLSVRENAQIGFNLADMSKWHGSLTTIVLGNPSTPLHDQVLLSIVASCPNLQHLTIAGEIQCKIVIELAKLNEQWATFSFPDHKVMHCSAIPPSSLVFRCPMAVKRLD